MSIVPPGTLESKEVVSDETLNFDYPGSDIVLRSCDAHDFRVPKLYIINSSPVLRELIRSISNTSGASNGKESVPLPVVELRESNAPTLYSLLTFIFPVTPILPSTSEKITELLAVAQKYQMDSVLSHIRGAIARLDPPFIRPETALHVYILAQKHELHQEARQAARVTFLLSMTIEGLGDKLDSPGMTGAYLRELWEYHARVRNELRPRVKLSIVLSDFPDNVKGLRCRAQYNSNDNSLPVWLGNYIESIADAPHLLDSAEFENTRARHVQDMVNNYGPCTCVNIPGQTIRAFWEALTSVVHKAMEKVRRSCMTRLYHENLYEFQQADSTLALVKEESTSSPFVPLCLKVPDADIIIRSSDRVNFRVHKSLLAMSSPFFEDLLSLPQPPDSELVDGLPVVQLPEGAGLLNSLVSLLYPVSPVIPSSYENVFALLAACQKYDMESIQSYIRAEMNRGTFPAPIKAEGFRAYAIASSMGLVPEMENAARLTLGSPMTFESLGEELRSFKGRALRDLIRFRVENNSSGQGS